MGAQKGHGDGARTGARQHVRQQSLLQQGLGDPEVEIDQSPAGAEHQGRAAVTVAGAAEQIQLRSVRHLAPGQTLDVAKCLSHAIDIVLDQLLGAKPGLAVKNRLAHAAQIAVHALFDGEHQTLVVTLGTQGAKVVHPLTQVGVVVQGTDVALSPALTPAEAIQSLGRFGPGGVIRRVMQAPPQQPGGDMGAGAGRAHHGVIRGGRRNVQGLVHQ